MGISLAEHKENQPKSRSTGWCLQCHYHSHSSKNGKLVSFVVDIIKLAALTNTKRRMSNEI
jgi:hypothetical protein